MAMNLRPGAVPEPEVMMDINTTPLIDVMLVLLIMLIITIPIQLHAVNLNMPVGNGTELLARLRKFADMKPQPEVQIRGDAAADFEAVGRVMSAVQRAGIGKVGFITEPGH